MAGTSTMPPPPPGLLSAGPPSFGGLAGFLQRSGCLPRRNILRGKPLCKCLSSLTPARIPWAEQATGPILTSLREGMCQTLSLHSDYFQLSGKAKSSTVSQIARSHVRAQGHMSGHKVTCEREAAVFQVEILSVAECLGTQPLWTGNRFYASID